MTKVIGSVSDTPHDFPDVTHGIYWDVTFIMDDDGNEECTNVFATARYKADVDKWFSRWFKEWSRNAV